MRFIKLKALHLSPTVAFPWRDTIIPSCLPKPRSTVSEVSHPFVHITAAKLMVLSMIVMVFKHLEFTSVGYPYWRYLIVPNPNTAPVSISFHNNPSSAITMFMLVNDGTSITGSAKIYIPLESTTSQNRWYNSKQEKSKHYNWMKEICWWSLYEEIFSKLVEQSIFYLYRKTGSKYIYCVQIVHKKYFSSPQNNV